MLLAFVAACSGGDGEAVAESKLPQLVLQASDLSRAWVRFDEGRQGRIDTPPGSRADPERFGRRGGWKARYRREGTPATPGPLVIDSRADLFSGTDGAKQDFEALEEALNATLGGSIKRIEVSDLGDQAVGAEALQGTGAAAVRFYSIAWRQENVVAAMLVNGFAGSLEFDDILALARKQERRIADAAG